MAYEEENSYTNYDPSGNTPQELLAQILSVKDRIRSTVTRLGVAESSIEQNAEEILLRVEKNGVIAAINLSPETIQIQAENINLVGAVTVLSDITGDLGTITAGNIYGVNIYGGTLHSDTFINVTTDAYIGDSIYIGAQSGVADIKHIKFSTYDGLSYHNGAMNLNADSIGLNAPTYVEGYQVATRSWVQSQGYSTGGGNYVGDPFGQGLSLYQDATTGRIVVLKNGVNLGALAWN